MSGKRRELKPPSERYLEQAKALSKLEAERLMSRMRGRFSRRLEDRRLTCIEVLALQLEHEDEELKEWRKNVARIRERNSK
jgi:hypothetical protein